MTFPLLQVHIIRKGPQRQFAESRRFTIHPTALQRKSQSFHIFHFQSLLSTQSENKR